MNSFKTLVVIGCFRFLIQLKFYIKSHVRLYKIPYSLVVFLTSISFIRYKVTVMVLIFFVFPSWITNIFKWYINKRTFKRVCKRIGYVLLTFFNCLPGYRYRWFRRQLQEQSWTISYNPFSQNKFIRFNTYYNCSSQNYMQWLQNYNSFRILGFWKC